MKEAVLHHKRKGKTVSVDGSGSRLALLLGFSLGMVLVQLNMSNMTFSQTSFSVVCVHLDPWRAPLFVGC